MSSLVLGAVRSWEDDLGISLGWHSSKVSSPVVVWSGSLSERLKGIAEGLLVSVESSFIRIIID